MRALAIAALLLSCTGCPPAPKPTPLRDAASPPAADACTADMGVPRVCESLFRADGSGVPCVACPVSTPCTWDRQAWCVPLCKQGLYGCDVAAPDVP